jgi:phenylacetate-coenzyme A ligase PaaK-like adenylate-forming protein
MPAYDPRNLGPEPREPSQKYWDPTLQTMPRSQLRELQLDRLRGLVAKVLAGDAPLFGRKLRQAAIASP